MTRKLLVGMAAVAACSGPSRPGSTGGETIPQVSSTSGAHQGVPPPGTAAPTVPSGDDAKRDAELAPKIAGYVDAFTNFEPAFTRDGKRVVFVSTRDGLPQLYIAGKPDEPATRLLQTTQRVEGVTLAPGGKDLVFRSDTGADENWSIFRVGLDGKNLVELTPGVKLSRDGVIIPDGKPSTMFFSARKLSEARSVVYAAPATAPGEPKVIYTDAKPAFLADVSPDGKVAIVQQFPTRAENYVMRVEVDTGKSARIWPAEGSKVSIFDLKLSRDGKRVFVATDNGEEASLVLALDATTGKQLAKYAVTPATASINGLAVSRDTGYVSVTLTAGNHSELRLLDARTLASRTEITMPLGQGFATDFSDDGKRLAVQWSTPKSPTDLFSVDVKTGKAEPLRKEARALAVPPIEAQSVDIPSFDGGKIPTNVYRPSGEATKKHPVIVSYHGGPSGVSMVRWNAVTAYWLSLGYIVVEPNVRGSSGYGRAFEAGDNGPKRVDAFKDIETSARWVAAQPWADKDRLVVYGGSYGGYTVLVALSRWPELWRAGVDLFGVVDLKSFMATTSGLIRDLFLLEFGDPDKDAAFLASISPITDVAKIVDPTFVYAGANDPRVPRTESDLIVKALRQRHVPSEYFVADNEGHSVARRENQIALFSRVARFLETHLK
ncbi:MAG: S9 family peptidase [Kofleriaceae bacterium]